MRQLSTSVVPAIRLATRGIRRRPAVSGLAALTLALGIGAATTIFSIVRSILLDPFPYADAAGIAVFRVRNPASPGRGDRWWFSLDEFLAYQSRVSAFREVMGVSPDEEVVLQTDDGKERLTAASVTGGAFRFLGVRPAIGRALTPDDASPSAPPVFVASHRLWLKFGGDPALLNSRFIMNDQPMILVGVMPPRFALSDADLWRPAHLDRANDTDRKRSYILQARLQPNVSLLRAQREFEVVARSLAEQFPDDYPKGFSVQALSLIEHTVGRFRATLYTFAGAAVVLLLIACGNVANMLLLRANERQTEMAVRSALGASRAALVRQLLTESLLLAIVGAAAGCGLTYVGLKAFVVLAPNGLLPPEASVEITMPVLLFALAMAVVTTLIFGLVPSFQTARRDPSASLRGLGRGMTGGLGRARLNDAIVVAEVALSVTLLIGAGLLVRSVANLQSVDLGLTAEHLMFVRVRLPEGQYATAASKQRLFDELAGRSSALPGVRQAAIASAVPLDGGIKTRVALPAGGNQGDQPALAALIQFCSHGYFQTTGRQLLRGHELTEDDVRLARNVAVVSETFAKAYAADGDVLGRQVKLAALERLRDVQTPTVEIIGVVRDAKNRGVRERAVPEVFVPASMTASFGRVLLLRTAAGQAIGAATLHRTVKEVDPNLIVTETATVTDLLTRFAYAEPRFELAVLGVFAAAALALVACGVTGVVGYAVSGETRSIGIRVALGASPRMVIGGVLRRALLPIAIGLAAGVTISFSATRILASQLWEVAPRDPATFVAGTLAVWAVGLAAALVPARRAAYVDPLVALRHE